MGAAGARSNHIPDAPAAADRGETPPLTIRATNSRRLRLPASVVWLCDGINVGAYMCEWSLFAVYFADAYEWSSTPTGAAQMSGDLLAAAILAFTTTALWARLKPVGARRFEALVLQPPWNLALFFALYAATFAMLAQPVFAVSVVGQVLMGTIYVFCRQAVQEAYLTVSHGSLPLFRKLEFVGSISYNTSMATSGVLSVLIYEQIGMLAPFRAVAIGTGGMAAFVLAYFALRLRGRYHLPFAEAEEALLCALRREGEGVRVASASDQS